MFNTINAPETDRILALMQVIAADPRADKVDLVIGVYKDETGQVPVMGAVKQAEAEILARETSKTYLGMTGNAAFRALVPALIFGDNAPPLAEGRISAIQTIGGSGALKVACDMLHSLKPDSTVWVSNPTWINHAPVARGAGLRVGEYPYFRPSDRGLDFDAMITHLSETAQPGDTVLLHACCHNPTGVDLSFDQWRQLAEVIVARDLMPLVDCAYQGLGEGMEADVAGLRHLAEHVPELMVASSYSKNFGLYRERTGALSLMAGSTAELAKAEALAQWVIRTNYSMPPNHGAEIVAQILNDAALRRDWDAELTRMRRRILDLRHQLRTALEARQIRADLGFLTEQRGMFSYSGLGPEAIARLRSEFGIYLAGDGRISIAGLSRANMDHAADGFAAVLG